MLEVLNIPHLHVIVEYDAVCYPSGDQPIASSSYRQKEISCRYGSVEAFEPAANHEITPKDRHACRPDISSFLPMQGCRTRDTMVKAITLISRRSFDESSSHKMRHSRMSFDKLIALKHTTTANSYVTGHPDNGFDATVVAEQLLYRRLRQDSHRNAS